MKNLVELLKATAVGGLVFLVPLVVAGMVLAKALEVMRLVAKPVEARIPADIGLGVPLINLLLLAVIFALCLLAGLVAKSSTGKRLGARLETALLSAVPGYTFVKGMTDSMSGSDEASENFTPVLARFDDNAVVAFEVERTSTGEVVVYLPGAPNPWSGSVAYMSPDRVESLELSMPQAIKSIRQLGRGSVAARGLQD